MELHSVWLPLGDCHKGAWVISGVRGPGQRVTDKAREGVWTTTVFLSLRLQSGRMLVCDSSLRCRLHTGILFGMFCYSSIKKLKNQGLLPTQQRVALISVADEVCHTKHAEEEKRKDVRVRTGTYWEQECLIFSSQKVSFSISKETLSPDSGSQTPRGGGKRSSYLGTEGPNNVHRPFHSAWHSKCVSTLLW